MSFNTSNRHYKNPIIFYAKKRRMSTLWCHSQATCESFFAFILIISTIDYLASRVPGHPRAFFPVSDGFRTCWDSPKPLCTKLAFWPRVPGRTLIRNHRFQKHYYQENEKDPARSTCSFCRYPGRCSYRSCSCCRFRSASFSLRSAS